jgi:hypothetical protein
MVRGDCGFNVTLLLHGYAVWLQRVGVVGVVGVVGMGSVVWYG